MNKSIKDMPKINMENLKNDLLPQEFAIIRRIIVTSGEERGQGYLKKSRPKETPIDPLSGQALYVWKMVQFILDPKVSYPLQDDQLLQMSPVEKLNALAAKVINNITRNPKMT